MKILVRMQLEHELVQELKRVSAELEVESDVVLCSAKGTVGVHMAEHAMALALTRGINRALRKPNWDQRFPIRAASWELIDRTMGFVGLGGTGRDLAQRARAFGMRIIAVDPEDVEVPSAVEGLLGNGRVRRIAGTIRCGGDLCTVDAGDQRTFRRGCVS